MRNVKLDTCPFAAQSQNARMLDQTTIFLTGLRRYIDSRPELTIAGVASDANISKSTLHKLFQGAGHSPKISTLEALAEAVGLSYDAVIALGRSDRHEDILAVVAIFEKLSPSEKAAAQDYLEFLRAKSTNE
ncbi:helix-turn-helix domain-containing protein [Dinoroseobacter sp. S124A]|uniref:helix-turn-helix domain-containing protein n=1 Tax=Dinoroseobacter sp. S124A TaxID=3415128 RepID=UPI003C79A007